MTVTDDDAADVTIEPTALSVVAGRSNEYTVALATEPTGEVTVTVSGHASADVTLDKTTLTFTVDNWDTAQTVTVSATQNAATGKVTLAHAVAGADYGSVTAEPVVVSVVGVAGQQPTLQVGVSSSTQTLTVPEGGANSYTLVLGSRPTGDVTVGVTLPTGTDLTLDKTSLTFTMDNWDDAQTVAVTAAEDDDAVTDAGVRLTHTVSGGGYGSTTVPDVEVSITENDTAGVVISKDSLTVGEGDAAGSSYTVKLATRPSGSVSVTITGHAGTDLTLDKTTLTFTVDNWDVAQTVTVKAGQDVDGSANDTATLTHTASGGDYASVSNTLPVTVTDDDDGGGDDRADGAERCGGPEQRVHRGAGHRADGRGHRDRLRPCWHGCDAGQDDADLHGGQLGHGADGHRLSYSERRHSEGYPGACRCGVGLRFRHRGAGGRLGGGCCRSAADPSGRGELIDADPDGT